MLIERARRVVETRFGLVVTLILAVAAVLAVALRFVQDDAFISYRYAWNLIHGYGLVWEPGVAVQGYTNLLWTLLIAGGMALGADPVVVSHTLSIGCFLVTLWLVLDLARRMTGSAAVAVGAAAFLLVNFTFVSYATGGLETMLQTALVTAALWQTWRIVSEGAFTVGRLAALSVLFGLAGLTRLDSAVFIIGLSLVVLAIAWRTLGRGGAARVAVPLFGPGAVALAGYLAFSLGMYGEVLPNTYYAKAGGFSAAFLENGVQFVLLFVTAYGFAPPAMLILAWIVPILRQPVMSGALGIVLIWLVYVILNGGGFMEFRFIVPILPFVTLLVVWAWADLASEMPLRPAAWTAAIALAALTSMSAHHAVTFGYVQGVESIGTLRYNLYGRHKDLVGIGRKLREVFPGGYDQGPRIAISAAGAVPYYSKLRTVDILGLNDRWVARHGPIVSNRPGHRRMAPLSYILDEGVDLFIGYPVRARRDGVVPAFCPSDFRLLWKASEPDEVAALDAAPVVLMPFNPDYMLAMIYLRPHPAVEAALAAGEVRVAQYSFLGDCNEESSMTLSTAG